MSRWPSSQTFRNNLWTTEATEQFLLLNASRVTKKRFDYSCHIVSDVTQKENQKLYKPYLYIIKRKLRIKPLSELSSY